MQAWIDFAKGPLFAVTFIFMIVGLLRHLILQLDTLFRRKGSRLRFMPWKKMLRDTMTWILPVRHMIRGNIFFSNLSFVFHIGIILIPLFLADHVVYWNSLLGLNLPSLNQNIADILTVVTILSLVLLFLNRAFVRKIRAISRPADYWLLIAVLIPFCSGFLAAHPALNPLPWNAMFLVHLLSAEFLFILVPLTKLSHIVLIFFDRISEVHWQFRPGAGERVAYDLFGKEAKV